MEQSHTLSHLDGHVQALACVTVRDKGIEDVDGLAELDDVKRQLSDDENNHHRQNNFEGSRFLNVGGPEEHAGCNKIAHGHNQEGHQEANADLQNLDGCLHPQPQVVGEDRHTPALVVDSVKYQLRDTQQDGSCPDAGTDEPACFPHARWAWDSGDCQVPVYADTGQELHARDKVDGVQG